MVSCARNTDNILNVLAYRGFLVLKTATRVSGGHHYVRIHLHSINRHFPRNTFLIQE